MHDKLSVNKRVISEDDSLQLFKRDGSLPILTGMPYMYLTLRTFLAVMRTRLS